MPLAPTPTPLYSHLVYKIELHTSNLHGTVLSVQLSILKSTRDRNTCSEYAPSFVTLIMACTETMEAQTTH